MNYHYERMMAENIKLIENKDLDMSFLKSSFRNQEEMSLVNPSATFPFDENYWRNFYQMDSGPAYSLLLKMDNITIAHAALKSWPDKNQVFLCFVFLAEDFRGKGYSERLLIEVENFLKENFDASEYYLNVLLNNIPAIKCYEKFGFKEFSRKDDKLQMQKKF